MFQHFTWWIHCGTFTQIIVTHFNLFRSGARLIFYLFVNRLLPDRMVKVFLFLNLSLIHIDDINMRFYYCCCKYMPLMRTPNKYFLIFLWTPFLLLCVGGNRFNASMHSIHLASSSFWPFRWFGICSESVCLSFVIAWLLFRRIYKLHLLVL